MKKKEPIEKSLARIDEIAAMLEKGDLSLEDSLKLYEEGSRLIAACRERLTHAAGELIRIDRETNGESAGEEND